MCLYLKHYVSQNEIKLPVNLWESEIFLKIALYFWCCSNPVFYLSWTACSKLRLCFAQNVSDILETCPFLHDWLRLIPNHPKCLGEKSKMIVTLELLCGWSLTLKRYLVTWVTEDCTQDLRIVLPITVLLLDQNGCRGMPWFLERSLKTTVPL